MIFLRRFLLIFFSLFARFVPGKRLTVLLYHSISNDSWHYAVRVDEFRKQMRYIAAHADVVPIFTVLEYVKGKKLTRNAIAVTFDDGYRDFLTNALPILKEFNIPATVFMSLTEADKKEVGSDKELLREEDAAALKDPLVNLASHALTHRKLTRLSPAELHHELTHSRELITERFGQTVEQLAYPKGMFSKDVVEAARGAGYEAAFTTEPRSVRMGEDPYTLPRVEVHATTSLPEFKARLTRAADWYNAIRRFF